MAFSGSIRSLARVAGVAAVGVGAWGAHNVRVGTINPGGVHRYDRQWRLGPVENHGGAAEFWSELRRNPNGRFPMTRVNGAMREAGDIVHLQFARENPNPVRVVEVTDNSVRLEALPGHTFQGTATHSVSEEGGDLIYRIQGRGPSGAPGQPAVEPVLLQAANVAFSQVGWSVNMPVIRSAAEIAAERAFDRSAIVAGWS